MMTIKPLITICGTTAVGKSRLAVELAEFVTRRTAAQGSPSTHPGSSSVENALTPDVRARIINADAMQVYAGLDIITNKIPVREQKGVEHALMGFVQPGHQYVVGEWVKDATAIIEKTHLENKLPIVVGGTSYWIQHLLFPTSLPSSKPPTNVSRSPPSSRLSELVKDLSKEQLALFQCLPELPPSAKSDPESAFALHTLLTRLDPVMAKRWHWKDTRKVLRNLAIISEFGRPASEVIIDTHSANVSQRCRYDALVFWIYSEPTNLNERIDSRVDSMYDQGLLDEVLSLRTLKTQAGGPSEVGTEDHGPDTPDFESGIFQAIGYKEFVTHLQSRVLPDGNVPGTMKSFFEPALTQMKHNTRKYAQRQVKWIRNKLLPAVQATSEQRQDVDSTAPRCIVYLLDATEVDERWDTNVLQKAEEITEAFLDHSHLLPDPGALSPSASTMLNVRSKPTDPSDVLEARSKLTCSVCTLRSDQPVMLEEGEEWEKHQRTRSHRRLAQRQSRGDVKQAQAV